MNGLLSSLPPPHHCTTDQYLINYILFAKINDIKQVDFLTKRQQKLGQTSNILLSPITTFEAIRTTAIAFVFRK